MSRRPPNPAAERAAKNQATIKSLLKLEANKVCADCKRNKHPRWASWNLGVFVCIRCSGIHRGMGTHISRVKSVDLDSWTDEQLQSILSWGNARANKYWEAKLASGHVPSEAKIENFIRTKYELKRWVMEGEMPDPSSLDVECDDDIPLSVVKEKVDVTRRESVRKASVGKGNNPRTQAAAPNKASTSAIGDLLGGDDIPPRSATSTAPPSSKGVAAPPKTDGAPAKTNQASRDSLLGLDFLGTEASAPPRPSSTTAAQSRPDLKQSILSLYATAPRPQAQSQQGGAFGGMASPTTANHVQQPQSSLGGLQDAFGSLGFGSSAATTATSSPLPPADPFANLGKAAATTATSTTSSFAGLSGGGFFDAKPSAPAAASHAKKASNSNFDVFSSLSSAAPSVPAAAPAPATSGGFGDLFDLGAPTTTTTAPVAASKPAQLPPAAPVQNSVFNLSGNTQPPHAHKGQTTSSTSGAAAAGGFAAGNNFSGSDIWGADAWGGASGATAPQKTVAPAMASPGAGADFGWGGGGLANTSIVPGGGAGGGFGTGAQVAADEEFGGWTSSTGAGTGGQKQGGGGFGGSGGSGSGGDGGDLFSNVWQ